MATSRRDDKDYRERVYAIVRSIPEGKLMTYGQIAEILGEGYTARTVGFVMHGADAENVPWHRVLNARGACSTAKLTLPENLQQTLLESEGIEFSENGICDLESHRWIPEVVFDDEEEGSLFSG